MTPKEKDAALRAEKFEKFPGVAKFVEEKIGYKAHFVADWVYKALEGYARHLRQAWVPITCEADLKQPPGLYWTTYISDGGLHVGSERIYFQDEDEFSGNTLAYIRIEEPEPWEDK